MRNDYSKISATMRPCPFCGSTDIRYSITIADKGHYYGQCYCSCCRTHGPRIRFLPDTTNSLYKTWTRYAAEDDEKAKQQAIHLWNFGVTKN